ncbi:MAG: response regulator [Spirochaetes bacterium]|nr:response regulator [Spirochaetota bacterium]MBU0956623.1 response regulator [Spirochaetota bacterium]
MAEPYKIILVDDEDEVRGRISSKISAESGFQVVGTAGNGYDALELIEQHSPQVVLTDIKMPYIDGLELASIIRRDHPTVRIGFITGYDEFDYAREAIELNVRSYLTKPLTQEDISRFLHKLKLELDTEIQENYNREQIQQRYQQSLPLIIENYFVSLLASGVATSQSDVEQLRQHGVTLDDSPYVLVSVYVERLPEHWGVIEYQKLKMAVRNRLNALLKLENLDHYHFSFHESLVFIIKQRSQSNSQQLDVLLNRMVQTTKHFLAVPVDIGVSDRHSDFRQLAAAYEEADRALSSSRFSSISPITYYNQQSSSEVRRLRFKEEDARTFEHALRFSPDAELKALLDDLRQNASAAATDGGNFDLYILNLASLLANYAAAGDVDLDALLGDNLLTLLQKLRGVDQLFDWVYSLVLRIRSQGMASKASNSHKLLAAAKTAIRTRYADPDLTMEDLCDQLAISPSYLGQLFKKYEDSSFVRFLTAVRMEKAKELLATTGDRIVELAVQCGYRDVYYFSHSFKKYHGLSPKKYREEHP